MRAGTAILASFNLWSEPWITVQRAGGERERVSIEEALLSAHEIQALYEPSPLVVAGIHRLLVAVLQWALTPQREDDLHALWRKGHFPKKVIRDFGTQFEKRFDLFSPTAPFLQSADLPLEPGGEAKTKTVAYLTPEIPAVTEITHYCHTWGNEQAFCPACAAGGLVAMPAFATSGGAGIKPSINGVPPIYVLPSGRSLFEGLAASVLLPRYWPNAAKQSAGSPWWERKPVVKRSREVVHVGYVESLTFPARRVRLHPEPADTPCTRCGAQGRWMVRTMVYDMGESRPKGASFWQDPFAAYRLSTGRGKEAPTPVRPMPGKAAWREFAALFLQQSNGSGQRPTLRPRVLDQMADLGLAGDVPLYPFRCIGLRTDMKAKVFEWIDVGFDVPPTLLQDEEMALIVPEALDLASEAARIVAGIFRDTFRGPGHKGTRFDGVCTRMVEEYWTALAKPFRELVLVLGHTRGKEREKRRQEWGKEVAKVGQDVFRQAAVQVGDEARALRRRAEGEGRCQMALRAMLRRYEGDEQ